MTAGFIYFVGAETVEAVKIGFSRYHPSYRMKSLQIGCPLPLKILTFVEGSNDEEAALHAAFSGLRIHGEWFRLEGLLRYLVSQLAHRRAAEVPAHKPFLSVFLAQITSPDSGRDYELQCLKAVLGCPDEATQ